ncbi:hypothetical protein V6N11_001649 [Hibiscus sabdariffa]|uniref:Phosphofructokinase domain-containing protein n=1 Tax=Hibiscus sabdariffa TaxID=183260 RepID=A0ABR1ZUK0_9ROSI
MSYHCMSEMWDIDDALRVSATCFRDVNCCLISESPFYHAGRGGLYEYIENRHMVIVIAEGAGNEPLSESLQSMDQQDASGNKLLQNVGLWISASKDRYLTNEVFCCR